MSTNLPAKISTDAEQRKALVRKVQATKQELEHSWYDLKRDSLMAVVGTASVYVGYRVARWLLGGSKKQKQSKQPKEVEVRYVQTETKRTGGGLVNMLLARAGSIALDITLEKLQDNLLNTKKDKQKD